MNDTFILYFCIGHITFMIGLYMLSGELSNQKIAEHCKWIAINSLLIGGFSIMFLSYRNL